MSLYTASFKAVAVTAAQDLFEVLAPSDAVYKVWGFELNQETEIGDAQEEMLRITENRGAGATSGSGGSTSTPKPIAVGEVAAGGTVEINNTTQMAAGGGSITELQGFAWNIRIPYKRVYLPEERPIISPSQRWTLELESTPADSITMSGSILLEEVGG